MGITKLCRITQRNNYGTMFLSAENGLSSSLMESTSSNSLAGNGEKAAELWVNRFNKVSSLLTKKREKNLLLFHREDNHWKVN